MKTEVARYELEYHDESENHHKYWNGILYDDGTGGCEYGRIGNAPQYCEYPDHKTVESKKKSKIKKGYIQVN